MDVKSTRAREDFGCDAHIELEAIWGNKMMKEVKAEKEEKPEEIDDMMWNWIVEIYKCAQWWNCYVRSGRRMRRQLRS